MAGICFDSTTFSLYCVAVLSIIGYLLWKTYTQSPAQTVNRYNVTVNKVQEGYQGNSHFHHPLNPDNPRVPPHRVDDTLFRAPNPQFIDTPVPIPVHGYSDGLFNRMGVLYHNTNEEYRLPLFGRRDYPHSRDYRYYILDHTIHENKIELDCKDFLNDGDTVHVPGYPGKFTVHLYDIDFPWFHANVIGSRGGPIPFPR